MKIVDFINFIKKNNVLNVVIAAILSSLQFIGHLVLALSDGQLTYEEINVLMSSASATQFIILLVVIYFYFKKNKTEIDQ